MNRYPIDECLASAQPLVDRGCEVYQKFQCSSCSAINMIDEANQWYKKGKCQDCGEVTDIEKDGCNYMLIASSPEAQRAVFGKVLK